MLAIGMHKIGPAELSLLSDVVQCCLTVVHRDQAYALLGTGSPGLSHSSRVLSLALIQVLFAEFA